MNPVAASLAWKSFDTFASHLKADGIEPTRGRRKLQTVTLSTLARGKALVGLCKLPNKELCIISTFSSAYFEDDR